MSQRRVAMMGLPDDLAVLGTDAKYKQAIADGKVPGPGTYGYMPTLEQYDNMRKNMNKAEAEFFAKPCKCGHARGVHAYPGGRCLNHDDSVPERMRGTGERCDCKEFVAAEPKASAS